MGHESERLVIAHKIFPMQNQGATKPEEDRFGRMLEESKKLTRSIGLPDDTLLLIDAAVTDWEFILKIDALLEAAVKQVVKTHLTRGGAMEKERLEAFVDALPMRGRTSLLQLLKACHCDEVEINLIEGVRRLRNGFAHNILQVQSKLIEVIKRRNDKSQLIRWLSYIESYDEAELIRSYESNGRLLRFGILHGTMVFLILAYHVQMKLPGRAATIAG